MEAFRAQASMSVRGKLEALLDLERLRDPRIVPFLLEVLADRREATAVRIHILRRLRSGQPVPDYRLAIAEAILRVLSERSSQELRLQEALALVQLTDVDGVLSAHGRLALDPDEPIDLRYSASTSLQQAEPLRSALRSFGSCLWMRRWVVRPEAFCRCGGSREAVRIVSEYAEGHLVGVTNDNTTSIHTEIAATIHRGDPGDNRA